MLLTVSKANGRTAFDGITSSVCMERPDCQLLLALGQGQGHEILLLAGRGYEREGRDGLIRR